MIMRVGNESWDSEDQGIILLFEWNKRRPICKVCLLHDLGKSGDGFGLSIIGSSKDDDG